MRKTRPPPIPNISLAMLRGQAVESDDIHYDRLESLMNQFGRKMTVHRHDRTYQLHFLQTGHAAVTLDGQAQHLHAPAFFLTPPAMPHAFMLSADSTGHVLTVNQDVLWRAFAGENGAGLHDGLDAKVLVEFSSGESQRSRALPIASPDEIPGHIVSSTSADATAIDMLLRLLCDEAKHARPGRARNLTAYARLIFARLLVLQEIKPPIIETARRADIDVFHRFSRFLEGNFLKNYSIPEYAKALGLTESKLNYIVRRISGFPAKRLVIQRQIREACRLLQYSPLSISEIGYQLGFEYSPYFTRFFKREVGITPSEFRRRKSWEEKSLQGKNRAIASPQFGHASGHIFNDAH